MASPRHRYRLLFIADSGRQIWGGVRIGGGGGDGRLLLLLLLLVVIVDAAGSQEMATMALDHGSVKNDVHVAVAGDHRFEVVPVFLFLFVALVR